MATANTSPADTGALETLVRQWLAGRAHVHDLRVVVQERGLVLEGRAATFYAKQLAQHSAMLVTGLPLLANRIAVRGALS
ncbi:MAG: BON domain-containing protein [Gemmataceae bacterium]|nr:BON domain-containing protein [Gemmataceae bacterium]